MQGSHYFGFFQLKNNAKKSLKNGSSPYCFEKHRHCGTVPHCDDTGRIRNPSNQNNFLRNRARSPLRTGLSLVPTKMRPCVDLHYSGKENTRAGDMNIMKQSYARSKPNIIRPHALDTSRRYLPRDLLKDAKKCQNGIEVCDKYSTKFSFLIHHYLRTRVCLSNTSCF